ncbi:hypothetical protein D3C80_864400 [compost metagenome]
MVAARCHNDRVFPGIDLAGLCGSTVDVLSVGLLTLAVGQRNTDILCCTLSTIFHDGLCGAHHGIRCARAVPGGIGR